MVWMGHAGGRAEPKKNAEKIREYGRTLGGQFANMRLLVDRTVAWVGPEPLPLDKYNALQPFSFMNYCRRETAHAEQTEIGLETIGLLANLLVRMNNTARELEGFVDGIAKGQRTEEVKMEFRRVLGLFNSNLGLYELAVKVSGGKTEVDPLFELIGMERRKF
ncbi:MAG: hypothetical protein ACP5NX_02500 [Candidatus Bilamarchaeaceae archaeon]